MYIYYNPNKKRQNAGDCVIRALCKATNRDWDTVYFELCIEGLLYGDWGNSNAVWDSYLLRNGYKRYAIPNTCPECYTIGDFANDSRNGTYIVATGTHVVCVKDGVIYDSYDSSGKVPIYYYYKE